MYLDEIIERASDGIVFFDRNGIITRVNGAFVSLVGEDESILGSDIEKYLDEEFNKTIKEMLDHSTKINKDAVLGSLIGKDDRVSIKGQLIRDMSHSGNDGGALILHRTDS